MKKLDADNLMSWMAQQPRPSGEVRMFLINFEDILSVDLETTPAFLEEK